MPAIRRSATRAAASENAISDTNPMPTPQTAIATPTPKTRAPRKRKSDAPLVRETQKIANQGSVPLSNGPEPQIIVATTSITSNAIGNTEDDFVPAVLSFDFEEAKKHLIEVDHRFEDLFTKMKCKPFEHLEQVHPFR
jgi:DNA-3-methyladenine glycosylase II